MDTGAIKCWGRGHEAQLGDGANLTKLVALRDQNTMDGILSSMENITTNLAANTDVFSAGCARRNADLIQRVQTFLCASVARDSNMQAAIVDTKTTVRARTDERS